MGQQKTMLDDFRKGNAMAILFMSFCVGILHFCAAYCCFCIVIIDTSTVPDHRMSFSLREPASYTQPRTS